MDQLYAREGYPETHQSTSRMVTEWTPARVVERRASSPVGFCGLYDLRLAAFLLISATYPASFNDSRLISTLANAPSMAAFASAEAVVKSDFILGFVAGSSFAVRSATSRARSATLRGTLVACFKAAAMMPSPSADSR